MLTLAYQMPEPFKVKFKLKVSVSTEGVFGCTLPPDVAQIFLDHKIDIGENRLKNPGYFFDDTLEGIKKKINGKIKELCSEKEISQEKVIRYGIETNCSYAFGKDGDFLPNASERDDGGSDLHQGTIRNDACAPGPYGFLVYAEPSIKITYQYCNGKSRIAYKNLLDHPLHGKSNAEAARSDPGLWLYLMPSIAPSGGWASSAGSVKVKEIPYTHEAAMFFKKLMISIFAMNEQIKDFLEPDQIHKLIGAGQPSLPAPREEEIKEIE